MAWSPLYENLNSLAKDFGKTKLFNEIIGKKAEKPEELKKFFAEIVQKASQNKNDWNKIQNFLQALGQFDQNIADQMAAIRSTQDAEQKQKQLQALLLNDSVIALCANAHQNANRMNGQSSPNTNEIVSNALQGHLPNVSENYNSSSRQSGYGSAEAKASSELISLILNFLFSFADSLSIKCGRGSFDLTKPEPESKNTKERIVYRKA